MVAQETGGADLSQNGILVEALWHAVDHAAGNLEAVPGLVRRLLETDAWRCRSYKGKTYEHARFADFIATKPLAGCGWEPEKVEVLIRDDATLLEMWDRAIKGQPFVSNVHNTGRAAGNTRRAALARLKRERPDLFERVKANELSAHAAAVEAGFRHKPTPYETILKLLSKLTADEREHLRELL